MPTVTGSTAPYYEIRVMDNFHYMDEDEAYTLREYRTAEEALTKCKAIVDDFLENCTGQHDTVEDLYHSYTMFGEDPRIIACNGAPEVNFSGWGYAKVRARYLIEKKGAPSGGA